MSYSYSFDPVALKEYKDAIEWYKARSENAAENLVKEVIQRIQTICNNPLLYRNTYKNFRETSLKRYPYYIIYFINTDSQLIIIASLYHHKRNPEKKYRKLPSTNR